MGRMIAAVVAGLVAWIVIATVLNWLMRMGWPGYAQLESSMTFTPAMMLARLSVGALSSVVAGVVVARVARRRGSTAVVLGVLLLVVFLPVHYQLWEKFPLWYHVAFLVSLLPLVIFGAALSATQEGPAR